MGCFNSTCFVTQCSIWEGEPIRFFVPQKYKHFDDAGQCYENSNADKRIKAITNYKNKLNKRISEYEEELQLEE